MGSVLAVEADEAWGKGSIFFRVILHVLYICTVQCTGGTIQCTGGTIQCTGHTIQCTGVSAYCSVIMQCSSGGWPVHLTGYAWPRNPAFPHMSFVDGGRGGLYCTLAVPVLED